MKRPVLLLFAVAAVVAVVVVAWSAMDMAPPVLDGGPERGDGEPDPDPVEAGKVRIAGTVEDESGKRVPGAFVYLLAAGDPLVPAVGPLHRRTDGRGAFSLEREEDPGKVPDLIAVCPGFVATVIEHASGDGLRVVLARGGTIRGVVVDDLDRPVAGARVVAKSSGSAVNPPRGIYLPHHTTLGVTYARTLSGLGGAFTIRGMGEGELDLVAAKRGFPELLRPTTGVVAGEEKVRLVLLRPFVVNVAVVDSGKNEPLVSASVVLTMPGEKDEEEIEFRGRTDRRGEMTKKLDFPAARAPDVRVKVRAGTEDYGSVVAEGVPLAKLAAGAGFTLRLAKQVPAVLVLTVRYDTGEPCRSWLYFEAEPSFGDTFHRWSRIDEEGRARIELPPGHYKALRPRSRGPIEGGTIENLELAAGEEHEKTIEIIRGGDLHLTVTLPNGAEARGASVRIDHSKGTDSRTMWGKVLSLTDLPPGTATVVVTHEGHESIEREIALVKGERCALKLALQRIEKKK
ncbi:MAG: carboxypeptidase-like regulatory domain-containing protein [Planctomycetota bacterium]